MPRKKIIDSKIFTKKFEETLRGTLPLGNYHLPILHKWSIEKDPTQVNNKAWSFEPNVKLKDYTSAYQWYSKRKQIFFQNEYYFVPAGQKNTLTEREVNTFWKKHTKCKWASFDNFVTDES